MSEEIKSGIPDNGKAEQPQQPAAPQTDFKVAEIWIKSGQVFLEATATFWDDKCRALGLLEFCKDIVKQAKMPSQNKIVPANGQIMNFIRGGFIKKGK